jgi:hypothetical protein
VPDQRHVLLDHVGQRLLRAVEHDRLPDNLRHHLFIYFFDSLHQGKRRYRRLHLGIDQLERRYRLLHQLNVRRGQSSPPITD